MSIEAMVEEIGSRLDALREAPPGATCALRSGRCRKIRKDRNHIFTVSTRGRERLVLKIVDDPRSPALRREARGWGIVQATFRDDGAYLMPGTVVPGAEGEFLLLSRIPGYRLNRCLYGMAVLGAPTRWRPVRQTFEGLGRTLAALHRSEAGRGAEPADRPVAARVARRILDGVTSGGARFFETLEAARWAAEGGEGFVHGNLGLDNVLCRGRRVGLIDLENSGRGAASDDLGRLLQHLFCLETTTPLWKGVVRAALRGLVAGYGSARRIDPGEAGAALFLHLLDYYQTRFLLDDGSRRVALLPVDRARLEVALGAGPAGCRAWLADRCGAGTGR